jgi:hypothetical protein
MVRGTDQTNHKRGASIAEQMGKNASLLILGKGNSGKKSPGPCRGSP